MRANTSSWRSRIVYLIFLLILQELVLRICFPIPELSNFDRMPYWVGKKGVPFLRGEDRVWRSYPDTNANFLHDLNRYGFRGEEWTVEKPEGKKRILFIGDSFMEGIMAPQEQTIPQGFLNAAGEDKFDVLNAGVIGADMGRYLRLLHDIIPVFQPDYVIMGFFENDGAPQAPALPQGKFKPEYFSPWTPRIFEFFRQRRQNNPIQFRWAAARAFVAAVPNPSNPWSKNEYELSQHVTPELARAMKEGTFNFFRSNIILKSEENLKKPLNMGSAIAYLGNYCRKFGAEPMVFYIPGRHQVTSHYYKYDKACCQVICPDSMDFTGPEYNHHQDSLAGDCLENNVPFFDLSPEVRAMEQGGKHLYWNYDDHMRGSSYLWTGGLMYREWNKVYGNF